MKNREKKLELPFHVIKRSALPLWKSILFRVIAVLAAVLLCKFCLCLFDQLLKSVCSADLLFPLQFSGHGRVHTAICVAGRADGLGCDTNGLCLVHRFLNLYGIFAVINDFTVLVLFIADNNVAC